MKKVTLFLAVLIFASSLSSCYRDNNPAAELGASIIVWALFGKVTQEIPEATSPEIYQFDEDFNVEIKDTNLTIESSFLNGGQFVLEAVKSEEGSNWIIQSASINSNKSLGNRFSVDPTSNLNIDVLKLDPISNTVDLSFELIIDDQLEQVSVPMIVDYEGTFQ